MTDLKVEAELNESRTAQLIWEALPMEAKTNLWGEEIYFAIPVKTGLEKGSREVVSVGELGYWPTGHAFCIFFGLTPGSLPGEIRPASAVNLVGRITDDPCCLKLVPEGAPVRIEKK